jgi:Type IV secretion system pilin
MSTGKTSRAYSELRYNTPMNLQTFFVNIGTFLNGTLLPFIIALAGLFFIWNGARYFIIGGANPAEQEKARTLALWGVAAFVFIVSLWGIVNLLVNGLGFGGDYSSTPDYLCENNWAGCTGGNR